MATITGDVLRGHLETLVLSALRRGDAHGFEILRRLEESGSGALKLKEGSLYPALYRLEAAKMIAGEWEDNATTRRGPRRRIYRLTQKGRRRFLTAREEFQQFTSIRGTILGPPDESPRASRFRDVSPASRVAHHRQPLAKKN